MKRRDAREIAFLMIFEKEFHDEPMAQLIETAKESRSLKLNEYVSHLLELIEENADLLDQKIMDHLSNWKISRLPKVTLALLRLAVCELDFFEDIPIKVTINEAIELAKKYATEEDAAYINGVLGSYVKASNFTKTEESEKEL